MARVRLETGMGVGVGRDKVFSQTLGLRITRKERFYIRV